MVSVIVEKTAKAKLKAKPSETPLFWQSNYEFVAPYDFEECIRRISASGAKYWDEKSEVWTLIPPKIKWDSQEDNSAVFDFRVSRHMKEIMLHAELQGQFVYKSAYQTCVKVRVGFKLWSVAFLFVLLPFIGIEIFAQASDTRQGLWVIGVCVYCLFLTLQLWFGHSLKTHLIRDLHEAVMQRKSTSVEA